MKIVMQLNEPAHAEVVTHVARTYLTFSDRMNVLGHYFPDTVPGDLASALYCIGNGATWEQRMDILAAGWLFSERDLLPAEQARVEAFHAAYYAGAGEGQS